MNWLGLCIGCAATRTLISQAVPITSTSERILGTLPLVEESGGGVLRAMSEAASGSHIESLPLCSVSSRSGDVSLLPSLANSRVLTGRGLQLLLPPRVGLCQEVEQPQGPRS